MVRREASALVWDAHAKLMKDSISLAFQYEPLPHPPLELPDFPALPPANSTDLAQQALGFLVMFERNPLAVIVSSFMGQSILDRQEGGKLNRR